MGLQQNMRLEKSFNWIWWSLQENNNGTGRAGENLDGFRVKPAAIQHRLWGPGGLTAPYQTSPYPNVPRLGGSALLWGKPPHCWHPWGTAWVLCPARPRLAPQPTWGTGYFSTGGAKAER